MSSFEIGASRPVGAVQINPVGPGTTPVKTALASARAGAASPQVETSDAVKAGAAPVDQERVQTIRHAVETGKYPILPAKKIGRAHV